MNRSDFLLNTFFQIGLFLIICISSEGFLSARASVPLLPRGDSHYGWTYHGVFQFPLRSVILVVAALTHCLSLLFCLHSGVYFSDGACWLACGLWCCVALLCVPPRRNPGWWGAAGSTCGSCSSQLAGRSGKRQSIISDTACYVVICFLSLEVSVSLKSY